MRSMGHPDYRYQPWPDERRRAASEAARARLGKMQAAPKEDYSVTMFRNATYEKRAEIMAAMTRVLDVCSVGAVDPVFLRRMIAFYSQLAHIVVRDAANAIERVEARHP